MDGWMTKILFNSLSEISQNCSLGVSWTCRKSIKEKLKQYKFTCTPTNDCRPQINLTCMILDCWKKPQGKSTQAEGEHTSSTQKSPAEILFNNHTTNNSSIIISNELNYQVSVSLRNPSPIRACHEMLVVLHFLFPVIGFEGYPNMKWEFV